MATATIARPPSAPPEAPATGPHRAALMPLARIDVDAWQDLANHAIEPNPFCEPWHVLPASRLFGIPTVLLVHGPDGEPCGLFPFSRRRMLSLSVLESWRHPYGFLTTPLIRTGHTAAVMAATFDWLRSPEGAPLWRMGLSNADGPFAHALAGICRERHRPTFLSDAYVRALMVRGEGGDAYLDNALSKKRAREVRRKGRALALMGRHERRVLSPGEDTAPWADEFLRLEVSGWKGREGSAFASQPAHAAFFRDMLAGAHAAGRLQMTGLFLDGRAVALKINFLTPPGAFAFKIAFDETLHSQSPGVVLEADNITRFHEDPRLKWMDSCADPGHPMIDKLWTERRAVRELWVATGRMPGDLAVSLMPLARWIKRLLLPPKGG